MRLRSYLNIALVVYVLVFVGWIGLNANALSWEGELNPTEFNKWEGVKIVYENTWYVHIIAKNRDETSRISLVNLTYRKEGGKLMEYSYFKEGEVYIFKYHEDTDSYKRAPLLKWEKERCLNCHRPKVKGEDV
jgi:hypothetical protein